MGEMITTRSRAVTAQVEAMQMQREEAQRERRIPKPVIIKQNWESLRRQSYRYSRRRGGLPANLNYENVRMFSDVLPDGTWRDQRCFIIGGGESLKGFKFSKLKNELTIGINRAYEKIDCTVNFSMDHSFYEWIINGKLGTEAKKKFTDFKGIKAWLDSAGYNYPDGIHILNKSVNSKFSSSLKDGIIGASNSGLAALNLAVCLGANPIYLLGFDMKGKDGKQSWWHSGYPDNQRAGVYKQFAEEFNKVAPELAEKGIKVINLNPKSELKCFEFEDIDNIKATKRPVITSYYTENTGYETQVEHLKTSLKRFNLDSDVVGIPDLGSWRKNVYYKADFIKQMMTKYPKRSIVFVDADAIIRMNPVLFNNYDCDFACHFFNNKELLSGTLYFGDTAGGKLMIDEWIKKNEENPTVHMPQRNLAVVYNEQKKNITSKKLPVEYCMIYDSNARFKVKPIIEHFQLSRLYKDFGTDKIRKRPRYEMTESLVEIEKFCKDKDICLLGNADSVLNKRKDIDSFDVVCRMNRGNPKGKKAYLGSRTDILFHSTHMSGGNINKSYHNPRFVVWMTVCHRLASSWALNNAYQNPAEDWKYLFSKLGINPTTGMMSLYFILNHTHFKSLTIYGFDFFATKTWYNTRIDSGQKHSGKKEKTLFMKMIKDNPKIKFKGG